MGQVINLREEEYQIIVMELKKMHTEQLAKIRVYIEQIKLMATSNNIFSTELTSKKVVSLLDTISNDIIGLLEQVFQDSETGVTNMIESVITTDGACG